MRFAKRDVGGMCCKLRFIHEADRKLTEQVFADIREIKVPVRSMFSVRIKTVCLVWMWFEHAVLLMEERSV